LWCDRKHTLHYIASKICYVAGGSSWAYLSIRLEGECIERLTLNNTSPLLQLPPQGKWCAPGVCAGLKSMFATCRELQVFASSDKTLCASPPIKTELKLEKKTSVLERRVVVPSRGNDSPNLSQVKLLDKKQAVETCTSPATSLTYHPLVVPPLNISKVHSLKREAAFQTPSLGLLASHRDLLSTAFMTISSEQQHVSFCMPRGMNRHIKTRNVKLPVPPPQKHHPISTSRQPIPREAKSNASSAS
jgi:hypothetical protein